MLNSYITKPYGREVHKNFYLETLKPGKTRGICKDTIKTNLKQMGRKAVA